MLREFLQKTLIVFLCLGLTSGIVFYFTARAETINTSVTISVSVCGNGIVDSGEQCDDGNTVSGDGCSSTCQTEGGGGIGPPPTPDEIIYYTKVILEGSAYPNASVSVLKDGRLLTVVRANNQADFRTEIKELTPGTYTFGLWAEDKNGIKSPTFTITFYVPPAATTTVSGILLPPTINLSKNTILKGEGLGISGQSVPNGTIMISIYLVDSLKEIFQILATVDSRGDWYYLFDTKELKEGVYKIKAKTESQKGLLSIFSKQLSFEIKSVGLLPPVPPLPPPIPPVVSKRLNGDLNQDNRTNLVDFSIMLYWWGTSNEYADQNDDGIVDLIDFSIMLYWWTG